MSGSSFEVTALVVFAEMCAAGRGAQALVHATVLRSLRQLLTGYPEHEDDLQEEHASYAPAPTPAPLNTPSHHQAQQQRAFALLQVQLYEDQQRLDEAPEISSLAPLVAC
eukprot:1145398-Pelagomonas_calceolata.AAC.2